MAKVLIPLGQGFEELEAISVIDVLRRVGCEVILAKVQKDTHLVVKSQGNVQIVADVFLDDVKADSFSAVVFPGGLEGTQNLIASARLKEIVQAMDLDSKIVAAICAAPLALFEMGVLKDKNFTCYPSIEKQITNPNYKMDSNVVQDGNLITSKGPATALEFAFYLAELLVGKESAKKIQQGMLVI